MSKSPTLNAALRRLAAPQAWSAGLLLTLLLSACSTPMGPAPIEVRNSPQPGNGVRIEPSRRVEVPAASAPKGAVPEAGGAEVGTVKQGNVEARPLGPAPAVVTLPPGTVTPVATLPQGPAGVPLKSGPRGMKRPYSETALAELKTADAGTMAGGATVIATAPAATAPVAPKTTAPTAHEGKAGNGLFGWPSKGRVTAGYSEPRHMGLSFEGQIGDPVLAAGDGKVIHSAVGPRGFGNLIIVKHDGELLSVYANNKTLLVKEGQMVKKGQKIAELGESGTDHPKLYFEIRHQGKPVDPRQFLPAR